MSSAYRGPPSGMESKKSSSKPWNGRNGLARMFSSSTRKPKHISPDQLRPITAPSSGTAKSLAFLPPSPPATPAPTLVGARLSPVPTKLRSIYGETHSTRAFPERSRPKTSDKDKETGNISKDLPKGKTFNDQIHGARGTVGAKYGADGVPFLAPTLQSSPTFPFLRDPPNGLLAAANPSSATSRPRGASTSTHTTQPHAAIFRHPGRPSTTTTDSPHAQVQRAHGKHIGLPPNFFDTGPLSDDSGYYSSVINPLEIAGDGDEVRTSFRSALTSSSIFPDGSSTGRSSVGTKDTSFSDLGAESVERSSPKDCLLTVDEAIDMYAAGFLDDDDTECMSPEDASTKEVEHGVSKSIYDAINESIGSDLLPPVRPSSFASNTSIAALSGRAFPNEPAEPPPLRPPTQTRDQYGFLKAAHQITDAQHDAWNEKYMLSQENRVTKWFTYMKDEGLPTHPLHRFPHRCAKTQRFIRKGIPPAWRGAAWFWYAGGHQLLQRDPDLYSALISCSETALSESDKEIIERDLHRTFPDNIHFKPDGPSDQTPSRPSPETPLLSSLRRVLRAFAVYCPRIGYCQSLNFITGLLLLFLPEEKTFWMLRIITTDYLPGTHDMSLEGANVDLWVLMSALKDHVPGLWPKIGNGDDIGGRHDVRLPPISLCTTSWFMSLFIGTLPIESVLRVWDVLFYEGSRTIFRTAIAVFKLGEDRIKAMSDPMEIFQVVQALPRGMLDVGSLMTVVYRRNGVSQEWVDKRRKERRKWYAQTRAKSGIPKIQRGEIHLRLNNNTSLLAKADSVWKRRNGQRDIMA